MAPSIRSDNGRRVRYPRLRRGDAKWLGAVFRAAALSSVIISFSWFAQSAEAEESEPPAAAADGLSEPSWIPSVETGVEVFDYNVDTAVVNHINGPRLGGNESEAERQTMFRIGGELMGPMFEDLPGRPRLFAQGGVQIRAFSSDDIFGNGKFAVGIEPERGINVYHVNGDLGKTLPDSFAGQGSAISARFQDPSWYAGLGVAFSVPIGADMLLYIKPSVQYSMERIDLSGTLTTVDEPIPRVDPLFCNTGQHLDPDKRPPPCIREFFPHRSAQDATITDHSVGAGLEVALVLFRSVRPIRVSLYAEARFMWLVSDSSTTLANDTKTLDEPNGVASYSVVRDEFDVKGGGGLRFSWVGFD